jgi:hypothetical protein
LVSPLITTTHNSFPAADRPAATPLGRKMVLNFVVEHSWMMGWLGRGPTGV